MYLYSSIRGDHLLSPPGPSCGAVAPAEPRGTSACGGLEDSWYFLVFDVVKCGFCHGKNRKIHGQIGEIR